MSTPENGTVALKVVLGLVIELCSKDADLGTRMESWLRSIAKDAPQESADMLHEIASAISPK